MSKATIAVSILTGIYPSHEQWVHGKYSPISFDVEEFRGIPFGTVSARWKHSQLRTSLPSDHYDATRNGPKCPQVIEPNNSDNFQSHLDFPSDVEESEFDCLNLFIVRPSKHALARIGKANEKLPVLLWIHGGAFGFGAGTDPMWDPTRLVLESISLGTPFIAVNLNYRLNLFGFAANTELLEDQANNTQKGVNFGLHDQKIGIEWVSKNISFFGGDPTQITLGGQSAGAASVHTHTIAAKMRPETPAFRRAIMQSGSMGCLGPVQMEFSEKNWDAICQHVGLAKKGSFSRVDMLRGLSANELLRAQRELGWVAFPVTIDGVTLFETDIGAAALVNFDDAGVQSSNEMSARESIEIMVGDTENEESLFCADEVAKLQSLDEIRQTFEASYPTPESRTKIMSAYGLVDETPLVILQSRLNNFVGDVMFSYPIYSGKKFLSEYDGLQSFHPTPVQSYKVKFGNPWPGPSYGVSHHCVELIYLFDAFHDDLIKADENEKMAFEQPLTPPLSTASSSSSLDGKEIEDALKYPKEGFGKNDTNIALRQEIQRRWIDFITKESPQNKNTQSLAEDSTMVYGVDRRIYIESSKTKEAEERQKRFEVLGKHPRAMKEAMKRLNKMPLV